MAAPPPPVFVNTNEPPVTYVEAQSRKRRRWLALLEHEAAVAERAGDLPGSPSPALLAFEIDALLAAANVSRNLGDDTTALALARSLIALRLGTTEPLRS